MLLTVRFICLCLALSLLSSMRAVAFDSATYRYDTDGRLSEVIYSNGERVVYTYDASGNVVAQTVETTPPVGGDLDVAVDINIDSVLQSGSNSVLTYIVSNYGPGAATSVVLNTTIPTELAVVGVTTTMGSCTGTQTITCNVGALASGSEFDVEVTLTPTIEWSGNISGTVSVAETDFQPGNDTATLAVSTGPSLNISATHTPSTIGDGDTFSYQVNMTNAGSGTATGFRLTVTPDPLHIVVSATSNDATCTAGATVVCDLVPIVPGSTKTVTVDVTANRVGAITMRAQLSGTDAMGQPVLETLEHAHTVDPPTGPIVALALGTTETGQYGNSYGTNQHGAIVIAQFDSDASANLELGVVGHDIDSANEVKVVINGVDSGFLITGPNNGDSPQNIISIPASLQVNGTNEIRFLQNQNVTWKWGVTDLMLHPADTLPVPDVTLTHNVLDTGQYGQNYGPVNHGRDLVVGFSSTGSDVVLEVTGYDIDYADEVKVSVDGTVLGYLTVGPNNGLNTGDSITIPASVQTSSTTRVTFYNKTATWIWGVTSLKVRDP